MSYRPLQHGPLAAGAIFLLSIGGFLSANARPIYAKREKKACIYCHLTPGGPRGFRGIFYAAHGHSFKGFHEAIEAKFAGVKPGATGRASKPTKRYTGKRPAPKR